MNEPRESHSALDCELVAEIAAHLAKAQSVLFITGAGISADSGLPTYRGVSGLYEQNDTEDGVPIEVALSGPMLRLRPELTWKYIAQIEAACRGARHNRAHEVIAALEERLPRVWVLTQNVDGFHRDAGSRNVIEIHGTIRRLRCVRCSFRQEVRDYAALSDLPPLCDLCSALVRPDVVLFGEMLPPASVSTLHGELRRGFDMIFSVGTTSVFPYIAEPVLSAGSAGKPTVEINPGSTEVSDAVTYRVRAGAKDAFEAIWSAFCAIFDSERNQ